MPFTLDEATFIIALFINNIEVLPGDVILAEGVLATFQGIKQMNFYEKYLSLVQNHTEDIPVKRQRIILG